MATKKKAAKKSGKKSAKKKATKQGGVVFPRLNEILRFRREWVTDPAPELRRRLSLDAQKAVEQARRDFTNTLNEIFRRG